MNIQFLARRKTTPRRDRLRGLPLFRDLTPPELGIVDDLIQEREYLAGEVIFDEGEIGRALYILLEGEVTICRQGRPHDGHLASLGSGEFFGELALLDDSVRTAQALAAKNCRLAVLFGDDFSELMDSHVRVAHKIGRQLLRHLGQRLRDVGLGAAKHRHL